MGGQSNAQMSMSAIDNATAEIADAANHPLIRLFTVGQNGPFYNTEPLADFLSVEQPWTVASPAAVGSGDFNTFSAIGYLFARGLQAALAATLPELPVGVISANYGGTCLSSWVPEDGAAAACGRTGTSGSFNLYNGLIAPLTHGPITVEGILFSQGECDADCNNTAYYECAFPKFIDDWRTRFVSGAGDTTETFFGFQVLPAYVNDNNRFNPHSLP